MVSVVFVVVNLCICSVLEKHAKRKKKKISLLFFCSFSPNFSLSRTHTPSSRLHVAAVLLISKPPSFGQVPRRSSVVLLLIKRGCPCRCCMKTPSLSRVLQVNDAGLLPSCLSHRELHGSQSPPSSVVHHAQSVVATTVFFAGVLD